MTNTTVNKASLRARVADDIEHTLHAIKPSVTSFTLQQDISSASADEITDLYRFLEGSKRRGKIENIHRHLGPGQLIITVKLR